MSYFIPFKRQAVFLSKTSIFVYSKFLLGWGQGGEMTQALYEHMNNKTIKKNASTFTMVSCN
jgi:hypothetical protein